MFAIPELRVGDAVRFEGLAVFPLFPGGDPPPGGDYALSEETLADGSTVVEEITEGGSVPQLSVTVTGPIPVLFLEGEELRGAKQNRVLNTSVLIAAGSKTVIPVSCVEQGRWRYTSKHFGSSGRHASPKMRSVLKPSVTRSSMAGAGHGSDQGAVWSEVTRQMKSMGASSETMAMADTYETHKAKLESAKSALVYPEKAVGLAVAVGDKVVAVDLFDTPEICRKVWDRLLTGVIMDAVEDQKPAGEPDVSAALTVFQGAPWQSVPPAGIGEEYRAEWETGQWHGSALAKDGRLVHGSLILAG